jgi:hypothetical protein
MKHKKEKNNTGVKKENFNAGSPFSCWLRE